MKRSVSVLAPAVTVAIALSSIGMAPALASDADGCYIAHGGVRWDQSPAVSGLPDGGVAETYTTLGPNAGTPGCISSQTVSPVRSDQLNSPTTTFTVAATFYTADVGDTCTAEVQDANGATVQQIPMAPTGSSISGLAPASTATRQLLLSGPTAAHIRMACTYGPSNASGMWDLPLPLTASHSAPIPGLFPGVSINSADLATNDTNVTLDLTWMGLADQVAISNDGRFGPGSVVRDLSGGTEPWVLTADRDERLPKTVYVRFHLTPFVGANGPGGWSETYTDDIILDTTPPVAAGTISNAPASAESLTLSMQATDDQSGVTEMETESFSNSQAQLASVTPYRRTLAIPASTRKLSVRVRDGAGNWSAWRDIISPRLTEFGKTKATRSTKGRTFTSLLSRTASTQAIGGARVKLQYKKGRSWITIAKSKTNTRGVAQVTVKKARSGSYRWAFSGLKGKDVAFPAISGITKIR